MRSGRVEVVAAEDVVVIDRADLAVPLHEAGVATLPCPLPSAAALADLLDVDLASERYEVVGAAGDRLQPGAVGDAVLRREASAVDDGYGDLGADVLARAVRQAAEAVGLPERGDGSRPGGRRRSPTTRSWSSASCGWSGRTGSAWPTSPSGGRYSTAGPR